MNRVSHEGCELLAVEGFRVEPDHGYIYLHIDMYVDIYVDIY